MGSYSKGMGQGMDYLTLPPCVNICLNRDGLILQNSHIPDLVIIYQKNYFIAFSICHSHIYT